MPADECIEGKYLLDRVENQAEFLKAMGGMKAIYAAAKNGEAQTFGVTKHSEDKYTVQTGHARNTFTIGKKFQHQFMGGQGDFEGNAKCT